jgi:hypothetical protein
MKRKSGKSELSAESELDDDLDYLPKSFTVVIDKHPDDPARVLVTRTATNLSGFELYGLLRTLLRAVEAQIDFPATRRSDGIEVHRTDQGKLARHRARQQETK